MAFDWEIDQLDLEHYLSTVGVAAQPPSLAALAGLHEAHVRTFPFENIDVLLDQHQGVGLKVIADKFLRGRGGYCFEHSSLLAAVLERLGYAVERRLARVGDPALAGRTHLVVIVTLYGRRWLWYPGFGLSLLRPLPMDDGAEEEQEGRSFRLVAGPDDTWALHRRTSGDWELLHTADALPVRPVDVVMGHHFTSTFPESHFRAGLRFGFQADGRHVALTSDTITIRRAGQPTEHRPLADGELLATLRELGVRLSDDEETRLAARLAELGNPSPR